MFQLVYASAATSDVNTEVIEDILSKSRQNNKQLDVTGLLLYKRGRFLQVLEGPEDHVRTLYENIKVDERHKDVITLYEGNSAARTFAEWEMGFKDVEGIDLTNYEGISDFFEGGFKPELLMGDNERVQAFLHVFRGIAE